MKLSIGVIIVIVILGFFAIKSIIKITIDIKNKEPETKYGKNKIKKNEDEVYAELSIENDRYERIKKPRTYSKRKSVEVKDDKYMQAKKYSDRIKITSLIGWIIVVALLIIMYNVKK